jgi:thiamine-phosphate pyrophosphorylase
MMADAKPRCRLYLQLPASPTAQIESQLRQALASADIACVLLCPKAEASDETRTDRLIDLIQAAGAACLIDKDAALAERLGADGVHIAADLEAFARARELLGQEANIGAACGLSRHDAIVLAEKGADYIAFEAPPSDIDSCAELIAWWAEMFVVPCVAWNIDNTDDAARLARLGADFVAPSLSIWQTDTPAALIADIGRAIGQVRRAA